MAIAVAAMLTALATPVASSRVATPIGCGSSMGAPWALVDSSGARHSGSRYYIYESNLSCREASTQVARLTRLTPYALLSVRPTVSTGERLYCLYTDLPRDIRSIRPHTAWGGAAPTWRESLGSACRLLRAPSSSGSPPTSVAASIRPA